MPIYSLSERVNYYKTVTTYRGDTYSYYGGNMFESLASTNPELFNMRKLRQINESKTIVKDFNEYMYAALNKDMDRFDIHAKKFEEGDPEEYRYFTQDFNQSIYTCIYNDMYELEKEGLTSSAVYATLTSRYLPDGLTPEGIKRLIRIRTLNNKLLVNALLKMLEDNYTLLNISTIEAERLSKGLQTDNSGTSIAKIRDRLKDPKIVSKFKVGNNYDFRPLGGAYMFMAYGMDLEGGQPSKYLPYIFKYDAIVIGHGFEMQNSRLNDPISAYVINTNKSIIKDMLRIIKQIIDNPHFKEKYKPLVKKARDIYNKYKKYYQSTNISKSELNTVGSDVYDLLQDMISIYNETGDEEVEKYYLRLDYTYQGVYSKNHIAQNMIDGRSGDWMLGNINTLSKKNLNHSIDVVRALKAEGFKNVMLIVCNPGHIKLPLDVKLDPNFTVTMGTHTVLKEGSCYTEGVIDNLNDMVSNIMKYVKDMISNCNKIIGELTSKFKSILRRVRKSFDVPIDINIIELNKGRASFRSVKCDNYNQVESTINLANSSIEKKIRELISEHERFISIANKRLKSSYTEGTIFNSVEFL